jgi:hypothetical protein
LILQFLSESVLLALAGGLLGLALSYAGIQLILALAGDFPNSADVRVDARVLLFTLRISLATAILVGLAPALQASRPNLNMVLRESKRKTTTASGSAARYSLAIAEVAMAMVLLVGAGLMINAMLQRRTSWRQPSRNHGHPAARRQVSGENSRWRYGTDDAGGHFLYQRLLESRRAARLGIVCGDWRAPDALLPGTLLVRDTGSSGAAAGQSTANRI